MTLFKNELRAARTAVSFFTRLPVPGDAACSVGDLRRAAAYFPLVGWLVGGLAAGAWWVASLRFPGAVASGLSLAATVLFTGAMHEDGLADVCDGLGGGTSRERALAIMQDSRIGAFGVVGLILVLGLKWQLVAALPATLVPAVLLCGHALSRAGSISLMATLDYAREGPSKARPLASRLAGLRLLGAIVAGVLPLALLPPRLGWAALAPLAVRFVAAAWFRKRLGGYTGDCLGAVQQVGELAFLLAVGALA